MWTNNIFSLEENRSFVTPRITTSSPSPNFPAYNYNKPSSIRNLNTWATTPSATYSRQPPPPAHRVTAFQSSPTWRRYFEASKATNKLIVVQFTATWCGPCRKMEPTIDEFAAKYTDVDFAKIDVDKLFDVSCEFGVQTMPTFLLMKRGKVIDKVTGARKEELQRKIVKYRV